MQKQSHPRYHIEQETQPHVHAPPVLVISSDEAYRMHWELRKHVDFAVMPGIGPHQQFWHRENIKRLSAVLACARIQDVPFNPLAHGHFMSFSQPQTQPQSEPQAQPHSQPQSQLTQSQLHAKSEQLGHEELLIDLSDEPSHVVQKQQPQQQAETQPPGTPIGQPILEAPSVNQPQHQRQSPDAPQSQPETQLQRTLDSAPIEQAKTKKTRTFVEPYPVAPKPTSSACAESSKTNEVASPPLRQDPESTAQTNNDRASDNTNVTVVPPKAVIPLASPPDSPKNNTKKSKHHKKSDISQRASLGDEMLLPDGDDGRGRLIKVRKGRFTTCTYVPYKA